MIVRNQKTIGDRILQQPNGCGPASAGMGLSAAAHLDPQWVSGFLRQQLRTDFAGATVVNLCQAIRAFFQVDARILVDWDFGDVLSAYSTGEIVLGVDASFLYQVPGPAPHAVLLAEVVFHRAWPFIQYIDPAPEVPARRSVSVRQMSRAFRACSQQALWLPRRQNDAA